MNISSSESGLQSRNHIIHGRGNSSTGGQTASLHSMALEIISELYERHIRRGGMRRREKTQPPRYLCLNFGRESWCYAPIMSDFTTARPARGTCWTSPDTLGTRPLSRTPSLWEMLGTEAWSASVGFAGSYGIPYGTSISGLDCPEPIFQGQDFWEIELKLKLETRASRLSELLDCWLPPRW